MTAFAKCRVSGPGAEGFLNWFVANRAPKTVGRMCLAHALNRNGGVHSEFTIRRESAIPSTWSRPAPFSGWTMTTCASTCRGTVRCSSRP